MSKQPIYGSPPTPASTDNSFRPSAPSQDDGTTDQKFGPRLETKLKCGLPNSLQIYLIGEFSKN